MQNRSKYQEKAIKNFYENRETISLQRLQEMVTDLYLAEGKKRQTVWKRLEGHLKTLGVKQPEIDHLVEQDNPELVANVVKRFL